MDHPAADEAADLVGCEIGARVDSEHARGGQCLADVDVVDGRVRNRRAREHGVSLSVPVDVVDVLTFACDETQVFHALD